MWTIVFLYIIYIFIDFWWMSHLRLFQLLHFHTTQIHLLYYNLLILISTYFNILNFKKLLLLLILPCLNITISGLIWTNINFSTTNIIGILDYTELFLFINVFLLYSLIHLFWYNNYYWLSFHFYFNNLLISNYKNVLSQFNLIHSNYLWYSPIFIGIIVLMLPFHYHYKYVTYHIRNSSILGRTTYLYNLFILYFIFMLLNISTFSITHYIPTTLCLILLFSKLKCIHFIILFIFHIFSLPYWLFSITLINSSTRFFHLNIVLNLIFSSSIIILSINHILFFFPTTITFYNFCLYYLWIYF